MKYIKIRVIAFAVSIIAIVSLASCEIGCGGGKITFTNTTQNDLDLHIYGSPYAILYPNESVDYFTAPDATVKYEVYYRVNNQLATSSSIFIADCGHTYLSF
ncbi:MAG: hypothetical protein KDC92_10225 [Bacteroidetes bacterium]|nr:hypothetical protein [Bacteroidota bacterium]